MVARNPLDCNNFASEAAKIPLPKDEVTPPVTKMNFAITNESLLWYPKVVNSMDNPTTRGSLVLAFFQLLQDFVDIFRYVHGKVVVRRVFQHDPIAVIQPAKLLKTLQ